MCIYIYISLSLSMSLPPSTALLPGAQDEGGPLQWETKWKPAQGGTHKDAEELAEAETY